jgi:hypothetical protein
MPAGSTAADLADGFAGGGLTVRVAPAPVSAFGHDGHHVAIEVPAMAPWAGSGPSSSRKEMWWRLVCSTWAAT